LPLHRAAAIARTSISNAQIASWIQKVINHLSLGKPLIECAREIPNPAGTALADLLTPTSSIGVTRKTLALAIAAYEQEALKSINHLTLLIGPILLLIVGGLIFAILIFLYLPLFNLANSI
jgi:type II secretory pathway component PulF